MVREEPSSPQRQEAWLPTCNTAGADEGDTVATERESKNSIEVERKMGELMAVDDGGVMGYVWGLWLLLPKFCLCFVSLSVICFDSSFVFGSLLDKHITYSRQK